MKKQDEHTTGVDMAGARRRIRAMLRIGSIGDEDEDDYIARQVRLLCFAYDLNQGQLALAVGLDRGTLSRATSGTLGRHRQTALRHLKEVGVRELE